MSMSNCNREAFRPRFKGIENFLRRIAFNLGNSPSQTEVKIISCIPIDVTDLQQKIITLEKEIEETKSGGGTQGECPAITCATASAARDPCPVPSVHDYAQSCRSSKQRWNPQIFSDHDERDCDPIIRRFCPENESQHSAYIECDRPPTSTPHPFARNLCKINNKDKEDKKKKRDKTQKVYYAETLSRSPFRCKTIVENQEQAVTNRSYLAEVFRKQYQPDNMLERVSSISEFSAPICRDVAQTLDSQPCSSEVYSCCHGPFHDLDKTSPPQSTLAYTPDLEQTNNCNIFYDSSLYDLVPVREKPAKPQKVEDVPRKRTSKHQNDFKHPDVYLKPRYHSNNFNCSNLGAKKRKSNSRSHCRVGPKRKYVEKHIIVGEDSPNSCSIDYGRVYMKNNRGARLITPTIYSKASEKQTPNLLRNPVVVKQTIYKNAECLTLSTNNTECQTASSKSIQHEMPISGDENKTKETLNQIKTILKSVLQEVKTNAQVKPISDATGAPTKDAVVQNGFSSSNIENYPSMMSSRAYSPFSLSLNQPSCTPLPVNGMFPYGAMSSMRCMQNYPLFIQTTGRGNCSFRGARGSMPACARAAAATNTDNMNQRSKESDELIKQIYKSIAVNMDYLTKPAAKSESDECKTDGGISIRFVPNKGRKLSKASIKCAQKKDTTTPLSSSPIPTTTNVGSTASLPMSVKWQPENKIGAELQKPDDTDMYMIKNLRLASGSEGPSTEQEMLRKMQVQLTPRNEEPSMEHDRLHIGSSNKLRGVYLVEPKKEIATSTGSNDTATPESGSNESDQTVIATEESPKRKKGLLNKVIHQLQVQLHLFKQKASKITTKREESTCEEEPDEDDESEASDSDDYETVYSQRSRRSRRVKHVRYAPDVRGIRRISYARPSTQKKPEEEPVCVREEPPERPRRYPYIPMEQELRREWHEKLAFHSGNTPRYSSGVQNTTDTSRTRGGRFYEAALPPRALTPPHSNLALTKKRTLPVPQWKKFILKS